MTITEAIQSIVNRNDNSILKDSNKFKAYLKDLCSDNPKELKVINRILDDNILNIIFGSERENVKITKIRNEFEEQGLSDNWIDFILQSFSQVLSWNYVKKETKPEEIISYTEFTLSANNNDPYHDAKDRTDFNLNYIEDKCYDLSDCKKNNNWFLLDNTQNKRNTYRDYTEIDIRFNEGCTIRIPPIDCKSQGYNLIDIPKTFKYKGRNYKITAIEDRAFTDRFDRNINIPDSVIYIGSDAFSNCKNLKTINFPNNVIECGKEGLLKFENCLSLKTISIPEGCKQFIFRGCINLKNVVIPNGVTSINNEAFANCIRLKNINIPNSVTNIGCYAFYNCINLKNIIIPNSVKVIGNDAFNFCATLENITIPDSVKKININMFNNCISLENINISKSTKIEGDYFRNGYNYKINLY